MKTTDTVPTSRETLSPLWTFRCENLGYDIALIPHSEKERTRLKREAKKRGISLSDYAQDEILGALALDEIE